MLIQQNYNFNEKGSYQKLYNDAIGNPENGHGRYLHATHLKDHVVAFFYFHDQGGSTLKLQVGQFTKSNDAYSFNLAASAFSPSTIPTFKISAG